MNPNFVAKWIDVSQGAGLNVNSNFPLYQFKDEVEGENDSERINNLCEQWAKRGCRHCHGRGFQVWDRAGAEKFFVACSCVQKKWRAYLESPVGSF